MPLLQAMERASRDIKERSIQGWIQHPRGNLPDAYLDKTLFVMLMRSCGQTPTGGKIHKPNYTQSCFSVLTIVRFILFFCSIDSTGKTRLQSNECVLSISAFTCCEKEAFVEMNKNEVNRKDCCISNKVDLVCSGWPESVFIWCTRVLICHQSDTLTKGC